MINLDGLIDSVAEFLAEMEKQKKGVIFKTTYFIEKAKEKVK